MTVTNSKFTNFYKILLLLSVNSEFLTSLFTDFAINNKYRTTDTKENKQNYDIPDDNIVFIPADRSPRKILERDFFLPAM